MDGFLDWFEEETTLASMLERLKRASDEEWQFWQDFRVFAQRRHHDESTLLSAFITIITFEINRVYLYWYEERRPIALDAGETAVILAVARDGEQQIPGFVRRTGEYLTDANREVVLQEG